MERRQRTRQLNAFAMNHGLGFGLWWLLGFVWLVSCLSGSSVFGTFYLLQLLSVPFVGIWFSLRFRDTVESEGRLSFGEAYLYSVLLYFYASLILALGMWFYLRFMDGGSFVAAQIATIESLTDAELPGWSELKGNMESQLSELGYANLGEWMRARLTPTAMSSQTLFFNLLFGLVMGLFNAAVCMVYKRAKR